MATDPFTPEFVDRLKGREYAYRLACGVGEIVQFKFFCCDSPYDTSVSKAPVVVATIWPNTQCVGVNVTVNIDASYSPLDTITTYRIEWGDGTPDAVPPPAWPAPGNIVHAYAAAGTYDIKITVTDLSGLTGTQTYQVLIIDCATDSVLANYMYALSFTTGPWLRDMTAAVPAWVQCIQNLAGTWLNGRDLKVDPHRRHLPIGTRHVWIATQGGVAKSTDNMDHWMRLYDHMPEPLNTAGDGVPPTKAGLDWLTITFDPLVKDAVYVLAGTATRGWVYWTLDGGVTWLNWEIAY
jgi:hypothetical protein